MERKVFSLWRFCPMLLVALLFVATACSSDETPDPSSPAEEMADDHALILYMQGDNGLEEFMDQNLQKVLAGFYKVADLGHIVVFYDRGNYMRLTELYMDDGMAKQRVIREYNTSQSSVDPDFMAETFDLIYSEVPAKSYGLILSSHGGGWVPSDIYDLYLYHDWNAEPTSKRRPLFYAQDGSDCMELPDLSRALSARKFDYILFDACFMASAEGLYDLRGNADYIIASSAEVLGDGFPYEEIVPLLFRADHGLKETCEAYMELYEGRSGTISLVDCAQLEALADAMKDVVAHANREVDAEAVQGYESFPVHLYYDLEQYAEQLTSDEAVLADFRQALHAAVPYTGHTPTFFSSAYREQTIDLPRSCGLTCHIEREEFPATHAAFLQTAWAKRVLGL